MPWCQLAVAIRCLSFLWPSLLSEALLHGPVTFDERSLMIGGVRELFLSGSVHYPRVRPADWPRVFQLARELGLNTIQTYVFWNVHEPHLADRGNASWSGWKDLPAFIQTAAEHDLYISLRIGPYICGEYYFGGIPVWLRDFGDIQCFRCDDDIWKAEMQRWVTTVVDLVRPLLQPRGNIMMMQIENEYSGSQSYLDWSVDTARSLTTNEAVPWNLCHKYETCFQTNARNGTYEFKALCAMNGFWMEEYTVDPDQPSPKWISDLRANNPGQPMMWTEDQGWFDEWGVAKRIRDSSDHLYGMARWFAWGGSYHNFYMLTGGNNYGLQSGGNVVTGYAPDTVISNFLLKHQPRYNYYREFFTTLAKYQKELLTSPIAEAKILPDNRTSGTTLMFTTVLPCTDTDPANPGILDESQQWDLDAGLLRTNFSGSELCIDALLSAAHPALVPCNASAPSQHFLFDNSTAQVKSYIKGPCQIPASKGQQCFRCLDFGKFGTKVNLWDCKNETLRHENQQWVVGREVRKGGLEPKSHRSTCLSGTSLGGGAVELHEYGGLSFLSNTAKEPLQADYLGNKYVLQSQSVSLIDAKTKDVILSTAHAADPLDQEPNRVGSSTAVSWQVYRENLGYGAKSIFAPVLKEQLNMTENDADYMWYSAQVPKGTQVANVSISTAGDSIAYPFVQDERLYVLSVAMGLQNVNVGPWSRKGVAQVKVQGADVRGPWNHSWILEGEEKLIFMPNPAGSVSWRDYDQEAATSPVTWFKAALDLPAGMHLDDIAVSFALDLSSMWKGVAYVNGFNIGRYWLRRGGCTGFCAPPVKNSHCYMRWKHCGKPTQALYHVPSDILLPTGNFVVLFEEMAPEAQRDPTKVELVALSSQEVSLSATLFERSLRPSFLQRHVG